MKRAGDIYRDPFLMLPGNADKHNLAPFYDRIVERIYNADNQRIVFFESVTWTDEFNISLTEVCVIYHCVCVYFCFYFF